MRFRMANKRPSGRWAICSGKVAEVRHCSTCTTPLRAVDRGGGGRLASPDLMFSVVAIVIAIVVPVEGAGEGGARS